MSAATEALCNHPVFRFFRVISDIPRPSKHEEQISQFLFRWARERGLEAEQDEKLNILIRKPATPGYEGAPGSCFRPTWTWCVKRRLKQSTTL